MAEFAAVLMLKTCITRYDERIHCRSSWMSVGSWLASQTASL